MKHSLLLIVVALMTTGCIFQGAANTTLTLAPVGSQQAVQAGFSNVVWVGHGELYTVVGRGQYTDEHELVMSMDDPDTRPISKRFIRVYAGGNASEWVDYHIELLIPADLIGLGDTLGSEMLLYRGRISGPQKISMDQLRFRAAHIAMKCLTPGTPSLDVNGEILADPATAGELDALEAEFNRSR